MKKLNLLLLLFVICLIDFIRSDPETPKVENICKKSQKFRFDGYQVNGVIRLKRNHTFNNLGQLLVNEDKYDFEQWDCLALNKTMSKSDLKLYNEHIRRVYTESFFKSVKAAEFSNYRRYIKNIRDSFLKSKFNITHRCRPDYEKSLGEIIETIYGGFKFLDCLTTIKENTLRTEVYSIKNMEQDIKDIKLDKSKYLFSFRNKTLLYYYTQPLITSNLCIHLTSDDYLDLNSTATVEIVIAIPIHIKNYDSTLPCLELDQLPEFYQE